MNTAKRKLYIQALETPYEKAIRLKHKLAKSSTHSIKIERAETLHLNPLDIIARYPRTFKMDGPYITFVR